MAGRRRSNRRSMVLRLEALDSRRATEVKIARQAMTDRYEAGPVNRLLATRGLRFTAA
jgi:hypothetical protein